METVSKAAAARKRYQQTDKGKAAGIRGSRRYRDKNPDYFKNKTDEQRTKARANDLRFYEKNKSARLAYRKKWRLENLERNRRTFKEWRERNRSVMAAHHAARRALKGRACLVPPEHRRLIEMMYEIARDLGLEVDHIIPLKHPLVCGLHTLLNLRLVSPAINRSKHNKFEVVSSRT